MSNKHLCFDCRKKVRFYSKRCKPCSGIFRRGTKKERFFSHVKKTSNCWLWTGCCNKGGYGRFSIPTQTWTLLAHRISWEIFKGEIPKGMDVLHHCDNPPCVRPKHLYLGTDADNVRDRHQRGRDAHLYGEDSSSAKLTFKKAQWIRKHYKFRQAKILAKKFGVERQTILRIVHNKTYLSPPSFSYSK
jgi:hypothetical protein